MDIYFKSQTSPLLQKKWLPSLPTHPLSLENQEQNVIGNRGKSGSLVYSIERSGDIIEAVGDRKLPPIRLEDNWKNILLEKTEETLNNWSENIEAKTDTNWQKPRCKKN